MVVTDGLVGYWHHEEGISGGTWNNIAPATKGQHNGTIYGAVLQQDGMYFDGSSWVTIDVSIVSSFTIEAWVKRTSGVKGNQAVISSSNNIIGILSSLDIVIVSMRSVDVQTGINAIDDGFNLITVTFDGDSLKLYINGNLSAEESGGELETTTTLYIGKDEDGNLDGLDGHVAAVRLYDRALNDAEVANNYSVGMDIGLSDDGGGEPIQGTSVFDMRQTIYDSGATNHDTKQSMYNRSSTSLETRQCLYRTDSRYYDIRNIIFRQSQQSHDLRQSIYTASTADYATLQALYKVASTLFDTLQEIVSDGIPGTSHFDMRMSLFSTSSQTYDTRQAYYRKITNHYDLLQAIYATDKLNGDINIVIHADGSEKADLQQTIYQSGITTFDTLQILYDPDTSLISTVKLEGSRELNIYLSGNRNLETRLEGKQELIVNLKGVIK